MVGGEATTSLPLPLSPRISTGRSVRATPSTVSRSCLHGRAFADDARHPGRALPLVLGVGSHQLLAAHARSRWPPPRAARGRQGLGVLRREAACFLLSASSTPRRLAGACIDQRHRQQVAVRRPDSLSTLAARPDPPRRHRPGTGSPVWMTRPTMPSIFGHAQFVVRQAEGRSGDQLLAGFVPQEEACTLAAKRIVPPVP